MLTKIFYFSGTGNSLFAARQIAAKLDNVELVAISKSMNNFDSIEAERIGFVFPVYAWGLPRIVADFVKQIKLSGEEYTFAVATCGGTPGNTLIQLKGLLNENGGDLKAGFAVREASYTFLEGNIFMKLMRNIAGEPPLPFAERLSEIIEVVENKQQHKLETSSKLANLLGGMIHKGAIKQFKEAAADFWSTEDCNLCGKCVELCPRDNISLVDDSPAWGDNCELCFACIQWCPEEAIEYQEVSIGKQRDHNRQISLEDLLKK